MLKKGIERVEKAIPDLCELAQGGTAVGTGLNTYIGFACSCTIMYLLVYADFLKAHLYMQTF